tara:strand:+ start:132 stop:548 length:417 start_codon:yes stop_codon:yes gene_type:complete
MSNYTWKVYLSGEIHTAWREDIRSEVHASGLPVNILGPVTIHEDSDDCGAVILGAEQDKFWHDRKGAAMNAIRTRALIGDADIVVVRFGDKFRQWNAAYDAGVAVALGHLGRLRLDTHGEVCRKTSVFRPYRSAPCHA